MVGIGVRFSVTPIRFRRGRGVLAVRESADDTVGSESKPSRGVAAGAGARGRRVARNLAGLKYAQSDGETGDANFKMFPQVLDATRPLIMHQCEI